MALNAKVPVFDPSTPTEARAMIRRAFELSERHGIPVMLRPTTRLCHAAQSLAVDEADNGDSPIPTARFRKDPPRWTATPKFRYLLHLELAEKLAAIATEFSASDLNYVVNPDAASRIGVIASGVAFETTRNALEALGVQVPILKIGTPFPLPGALVSDFMVNLEVVIVLEETDACIELQLPDRRQVRGRLDRTVPAAGELTPEIIFSTLASILQEAGITVNPPPLDAELQSFVTGLPLPARRPRLCPGCSHRSAFFTIKRTFGPQAIYPGDIGCYTLGTNLRAVDTFIDMGGAVTMANGFYQANLLNGDPRPIVATIGDSTFLHSGVVPLINAVHTGARFVLLILDNHTTAMTGFQPTAANDTLADGSAASARISLAQLVRACGVTSVQVADPYDQDQFSQILKAAYQHTQSPEGSVAVVIADRPCVLYDPTPLQDTPIPVVITEECDGCRYCVEAFECPALVLTADRSRVDIDHKICIDCGQCIDACYKGFIVPHYPVNQAN